MALKSVATPNPHSTQTAPKAGSQVPVTFIGIDGSEQTAIVNLNAYSMRKIREYNRKVALIDDLPEDDQGDAYTEAGIQLALIGTTECAAFEELTLDGLLDSNFSVVMNYVNAVRDVVFPTSQTPAAEA